MQAVMEWYKEQNVFMLAALKCFGALTIIYWLLVAVVLNTGSDSSSNPPFVPQWWNAPLGLTVGYLLLVGTALAGIELGRKLHQLSPNNPVRKLINGLTLHHVYVIVAIGLIDAYMQVFSEPFATTALVFSWYSVFLLVCVLVIAVWVVFFQTNLSRNGWFKDDDATGIAIGTGIIALFVMVKAVGLSLSLITLIMTI